MAAKKKTRKTRHGATQPEATRANRQVLLRLSPVVRGMLRDQSERQGLTLSTLVSFLVLNTWGDQYTETEDELERQHLTVEDAIAARE